MLGVGDKLPDFTVTGVKPGFNKHEEGGQSAFETLTQASFPGKWKIIYFYPKDFTFVCPTEIAEFGRLAKEFAERDAVVLGGSTDNEFCKLAWRRDHPDLKGHPAWQFADTTGELVDGTSRSTASRAAETRRKRCAFSMRCRRTNSARATVRSAATRSDGICRAPRQ